MSNRIIVPVVFSALAVLAGCGGGTSVPAPVPPPSGNFSNADLNGTYTFSVAGANVNGVFAMAGTFVACGCSGGTISSGTVDLNDPSGPAAASTIGSNSTYQVTADGRGIARLFITMTGNITQEIDLDFVLTSSSHGLVSRFDGLGTGSGTIDLQPAAVTQNTLTATPYAFFLSGGDNNNAAFSTVGAFTLGSSGAITTGVEDFNENGTPSTQLALSSGSFTVGSGTNPGSATLTTTFGSFGFSVYAIDAKHFKVIENDGQAVLVGDVFAQTNTTIPAGNLVFTMSGLDSTNDIFVTLGVMASDGASLITSGSEDVNDAGLVDNGTNPATPSAFTGSFSSSSSGGGRYLFTMSNFVGGTQFAAYPSSGGLLMLEVDGVNAGVTAGVAVKQQAGATVNASQGYGLNMTGEDTSNVINFDEIAEFTTTSTGMTGLIDVNDANLFTASMNGTYSVGADGFGSAGFNNGGFAGMFFYAVDDSTALLISTDSTQAALGSFVMQTPGASGANSSLARAAASMPMLRVLPHVASQKNRMRATTAH